jgi:hypothetical protein
MQAVQLFWLTRYAKALTLMPAGKKWKKVLSTELTDVRLHDTHGHAQLSCKVGESEVTDGRVIRSYGLIVDRPHQ